MVALWIGDVNVECQVEIALAGPCSRAADQAQARNYLIGWNAAALAGRWSRIDGPVVAIAACVLRVAGDQRLLRLRLGEAALLRGARAQHIEPIIVSVVS